MLVYNLSGLPMSISGDYVARYKKGTKPTDNASEAEVEMLKELLFSTVKQTETDFENPYEFPEYKINGENPFYNILNVQLPISNDKTAMMLFSLDMKGIAVSRGSACQSGSDRPSHVLAEILSPEDLKKPSLRISLSHQNTTNDIDYLIETLKTL